MKALFKLSSFTAAMFFAVIFTPEVIEAVDEDDYFRLITEVHTYYMTSCVFLLHRDYNSLQEVKRLHSMSERFSRAGMFSVTMDFTSLNASISYHAPRTIRPLFVFFVDSQETISQFSQLTEELPVEYPAWLLIFSKDVQSYFQNFSVSRMGNPFHLTFDSEMLVACDEEEEVQEWYAIEDETFKDDLASWDPEKGLVLKNNKSLYHRRTDLKQIQLRVATVIDSAFTTFGGQELGGLFGGILFELSRMMNFRIDHSKKESVYGNWDAMMKKWSGVIGLLKDDQADLGVAEFTMTTGRLMAVDFTLPLIFSRDRLYFKQPDGGIQWSAYFKAFSFGIWACMGVLLIAVPMQLTFMKAIRGTKLAHSMIVEHFLHVFGIYCQQGVSESPGEVSLRLAYFSICVSALVIYAAYSASLISYLTVTNINMPFSTLQGFTEDGSYSLIVFQNSAEYDMLLTSKDPLILKLSSLLKSQAFLPRSLNEGFLQVCTGKSAFYLSEAIYDIASIYVPCNVVSITTGRVNSLAMALPKGSPYTGLINYHKIQFTRISKFASAANENLSIASCYDCDNVCCLGEESPAKRICSKWYKTESQNLAEAANIESANLQRFQDNGVLSRLKLMYSSEINPLESTYTGVNLWGVAPILAVLAGGTLMGTLILILERMYVNKNNEKLGKDSSPTNIDIITFCNKQIHVGSNFKMELPQSRGYPPPSYYP